MKRDRYPQQPPPVPTIRRPIRYKFSGTLAEYSEGPHFETPDWFTEAQAIGYAEQYASSPRYRMVLVHVWEFYEGTWTESLTLDVREFMQLQSGPTQALLEVAV